MPFGDKSRSPHPSEPGSFPDLGRRLFGRGGRKFKSTAVVLLAILATSLYFLSELSPIAADGRPQVFSVETGEGFRDIAGHLSSARLVRSRFAFEVLSFVSGSAAKLKPGVYKLSRASSSYEILGELVLGSHREVSVTIPEGASIYEIDKILSASGVLTERSVIDFNGAAKIEGRFFPDTYRFFLGSETKEVVGKFLENFRAKAEPILAEDKKNEEADLILASLVEKEVPGDDDRKIVAGILKKRLNSGVPLQVDATVCYAKRFLISVRNPSCYPLTPLDFKIDSPYNTYLHGGLPPGPIGNPGISAIKAALHPKNTEYWYYLSDPKTHKTVFARTLEEHSRNRALYLGP